MADYTPTALTRVKRMNKRGRYDRATVHAILDAGFICHVAYALGDQPVATPTAYWREGEYVYWHGSSASRMLKKLATGPKCCLTVTHVDGLVVARSGFHKSINYRSVMAFGRAEWITDKAHKLAAMEAFVERLYPGRWPKLRPVSAQEIKATTILRMKLKEVSAKVRTGPPIDDDADYALPIWAGVIPLRVVAGAPVDDGRVPPGVALPAGFKDYSLDRSR
jgi:uncharacterized protein